MNTARTACTARFAAAYALMRVGADVGDHLVQSDFCARTKGATDAAPVTETDQEGRVIATHGTAAGRKACAVHCLTYSATQAAVLLLAARTLGLRLRPGQVVAALAISGLTHYAIDRRVPGGVLQRFADATGKGKFFRLADYGINGAYCMDGACHHAFETVAAAVLAR
ncbi:hypothetical protein P3T36_006360 [Kitasatospora sp. MAP12-15]|uniref:hypothetical protein n=1 Tax=unclassified Kitasatospora TaxID=2633591 RepID=UPI002476EF61|nr:hypothetical protein [Kitasatospora sp. MAP12-44]MDH6107901.1 hypothetical protein [Kitasatospora sp. MAP12-44]